MLQPKNNHLKVIGRAALIASSAILLIFIAMVPTLNHPAADASLNIPVLYSLFAGMALVLLAGYFIFAKKRKLWFVLLYTAIFLCNCGYFFLSISQNVEDALLANRISYLGAAYLPLIMLAIIADMCDIRYSKTLGWTLFGVSTAAFLLAASGGILPIYYKETSIETVDGATRLVKVYGPLHSVYSLYLFGLFATMILVIIHAIAHHKLTTYRQASTLVALVFVNIAVWFVEQFIHEKFEFLAVSYAITGLFILLTNLMLQDYEPYLLQMQSAAQPDQTLPKDVALLFDEFAQKAAALTASEKNILKYYAEGLDVQETAEKAFISIHTVRKHNANIYQKLSVSSRDELMLYIDLFRRCNRLHELLP